MTVHGFLHVAKRVQSLKNALNDAVDTEYQSIREIELVNAVDKFLDAEVLIDDKKSRIR